MIILKVIVNNVLCKGEGETEEKAMEDLKYNIRMNTRRIVAFTNTEKKFIIKEQKNDQQSSKFFKST